ncbi:MAG: class I SAM-dependent methyltransferase [candidate division FCPU426 bacterium]
MTENNIPCPVCASASPKTVSARVQLRPNDQFNLLLCVECASWFFHPLPSGRQLADFYAADYYSFDRDQEEGKGRCFAARLSRQKPTGTFLDVGCATGFMLNGIRRHSSWEVYGCEFSPAASAFARDTLGLQVATGQLADAAYPDAFFDVVQVNNVLEHVLDPAGLLVEIHRILKPEGRLLLNVPNGSNDVLPILDFWRTEGIPPYGKDGHLYFLSARGLRRLFERTFFRVERQRTHGIKRGLRHLKWLPPKPGWKTAYQPRQACPRNQTAIPQTSHRARPSWYYDFRFWYGHLRSLPGLWPFGLDFSFELKPGRKG